MPSNLPISRTIRATRRTSDIVLAMVRYGFDSVVQDLGLDRLVLRGRKLLGRAEPDASVTREPPQVRLRRMMEDLGPTFIKLGQILSMRPDLVPQEWADEFGKLQDDVPPVPFEKIRVVLADQFDDGLERKFESIDPEPLAAASIAQVHRAVLADGTPVVLKVLRPDVRNLVDADLGVLTHLAEFVEAHFSELGYSPTRVVDQFSKQIGKELDLTQEGRATESMRASFEDTEGVSFPRVYWEATTRDVLALEEIHGVRLSRLDPGELSEQELRSIVAHGADAVFRQCLEIGFFHADPHPGNILMLPGGHVCFIDCGMNGHIDPQTAGMLADLVYAVVHADLDRVIDVVIALGDADPALAENRAFRADAWEYISRFERVTFARLDMGALLRDFFKRIRVHRLQCPADIVFLIKAITTIEGVGARLLPSFDLVEHVQPHVERLVRRRYGIGALRRRLRGSLADYASLMENLPAQVRSLLYGLRRSRFTVNLEHRGLDRLTDTIEHASTNIAHAVFIAALILGSSILVLGDATGGGRGVLTVIAGIGFGSAALLALIRLVSNLMR